MMRQSQSLHIMKILVGCTGSVAAIKIDELVNQLQEKSNEVQVVTTEHAKHFFKTDPVDYRIWTDQDEWQLWKSRGDPVLHIELRKWADVLVIAPLDANSLAKISNGICDNLLTCVVRAWDLKKPLLFCPAMNTYMWEHPLTGKQIDTLKSFGYIEIPCVSKTLVCGDSGMGAMAEVQTIVDRIVSLHQHD